ncbi:MAG: BNR-4 repeat-containing protein [Eubacteriales bacterium]
MKKAKIITILIIMLSGLVACQSPEPDLTPKVQSQGEIVCFDSETIAGWSWHQRPLAVHFAGQEDKTYFGTIAADGRVQVRSYDHNTGETVTTTVAIIDASEGGGDDHNSPSLLVRSSDARVMVFWTGHFGQTISYAISENPEDISSFGEIKTLENPAENYSYTQPVELTKENKIYLFTRRQQDASGVRAWDINVSTDNGETFTREENPLWYQDDVNSPYAEIYSNGVDTIHFLRSDWMKDEYSFVRKYLTYCYYRDGAFYKANGEKIVDYEDLPITDRGELDMIVDSKPWSDYVFSKDIAEDENGYPVCVYTTMDKKEVCEYWYARWNGEEWMTTKIVTAGKDIANIKTQPAYDGGIVLNYANVNEVYLSREITLDSKQFEIEKWVTKDDGLTWELYEKITEPYDDLETLQIRPIVPLNAHPELDVLWVAGPKYVNYNRFETYLFGRFLDIE